MGEQWGEEDESHAGMRKKEGEVEEKEGKGGRQGDSFRTSPC